MFSVHLCHSFNLYFHIHRRTICAINHLLHYKLLELVRVPTLIALDGIRAAATLVLPVDNESAIFSAVTV